ncbi:MAG TPA: peptidoglycan recognition family protein [Planctomycetota bacterium]|nr:peptidoglycan recognition family protein [Planctomycetota bacterium]
MNVPFKTSSILRVLGVGLALTAFSGCGKKSAANAPDPELREIARTELNTAAPSAPVTTAPPPTSSGRTIRGPRSQAEIDAAYQMPEIVVTRPSIPRREVTVPLAPETDDSAVIADPSWDATITREWRHIVVHHSASANGSAAAFDKAHRDRGWDGLGYHFVIGNGTGSGDGEVEVGYRWRRQLQGAHAGNAEYNQAGIGICLVGDFEHGHRPSARQMSSLRRLVRFLQVKTGVPTSEVVGHGNVPGKSTDCPGRNLDMSSFRASLGGGAIGVPIHLTRQNSAPSRGPILARGTRSGAAVP